MAMGPARMLLAVIVLCWKFNPIENASWTKCDKYEGYSPGGRKSVITPIPSVAVSFDRDAAAAAAAAANFKRSGSIVAASAKIASQLLSSETKKTVSNAVKYFKKTATYLGPSLSIVSALLGFSVRGPTTTELLAKVNEGLDKLRKEINNRLDEMKGYVDNSIIESEKRAMNSHLFEVSKRWSRCASKFTKEAEIKCQEDVADIYSSKEGFFMTYRLLFRSKKRISESYDIKKVEVSLPVFSQYVTLRLVCLQTLINTFISDKTIAHSSEKLKKYMKEYKAVALGSARYISWAIKQILGSRDCGNVKYPVLMQQMKRFHVNTHIRSQGKIPWRWGKEYPKISYKKGTVVCDPVSKYKCQAEASQAAVDVKPNRDAQLWCMAKQSCQKYFYKVCLLIEKYWRKEVGETAERWTKLASELSNCHYKYTGWNSVGDGKSVYLDRHTLDCGGNNNVMTMFKLETRGPKGSKIPTEMRYKFRCCTFPINICFNTIKRNGFTYDGKGDTVYLDRQSVSCGPNGFLNYFHLERNKEHNKISYNHECCNLLNSNLEQRLHCSTMFTRLNDDGKGKNYHLDRHTVSCPLGYALQYFKLDRHCWGYWYHYIYTCCKVNIV